jgi:hypothetical protein
MIRATVMGTHDIASWDNDNGVSYSRDGFFAGTAFEDGHIHSFGHFTQDEDSPIFIATSWELNLPISHKV